MLVLSPAAAAAQSSDDRIIVPGVRIGPWRLAMTLDELVKLNGPEVGRGPIQFPDMRSQLTLIGWPDRSLAVATPDGNHVCFLTLGIGGVPASHATAEAIGAPSRLAEVLKIYGPPTSQTVPRPGQKNLTYDRLGIDFQVLANDRAFQVRIFKPGTAHRIWRL